MKQSKPRGIIYKNGVECKLPNRSVIVFKRKDDYIGVQIRRIVKDADDFKPSCHHTIIKGKIKQTSIALSRDGAKALMQSLQQYFNRIDF
jgi:hypothetical protein